MTELRAPSAQGAAGACCPCHGFGGPEILQALDKGAATVAQVFRSIGVCAKCGDCVPAIRDRLREMQELKVQSKPATKERFVGDNTKVKIAIMLDDGDKLEYEAHVPGSDLEGAKSEAERRLQSAVALLSGKGTALKADRVKIETH